MFETIGTPADILEAIFHATQLELIVPDASALAQARGDDEGVIGSQTGAGGVKDKSGSTGRVGAAGGSSRDGPGGAAHWVDALKEVQARDVAFFDERLTYFLALHIPHTALPTSSGFSLGAQSHDTPPYELLQFLSRLQLTLNASFLPPVAYSQTYANGGHTTPRAVPGHGGANSLFVPETPIHQTAPQLADPATPMPFPRMRDTEETYAQVEGVTVWEGQVARLPSKPSRSDGAGLDTDSAPTPMAALAAETEGSGKTRTIVRGEAGWDILYEGQAPVSYVRTPISEPVLGLTASITLRDQHQPRTRTHKSTFSVDTVASSEMAATPGRDAGGDAGGLGGEELGELDLLGGLAGPGNAMPASRLGPSTIQDLSLPPPKPQSALPLSAYSPIPAPAPFPSSPATSTSESFQPSEPRRERASLPTTLAPIITGGATLRKSYRRVLGLSPGLRVRMRSLVLPQLVAPRRRESDSSRIDHHVDDTVQEQDDETDSERRVVLCIEIENPANDLCHMWCVTGVSVEIGGKGGKATAELACDPASTISTFQTNGSSSKEAAPFPITLDPTEQYNLLYTVSIASTSDPLYANTAGGAYPNDAQAQSVLRSLGAGEMQRPVAISVRAYPVVRQRKGDAGDETEEIRPTTEFGSRWNCSLDLTAYFASPQTMGHGGRGSISISSTNGRQLLAGNRPISTMQSNGRGHGLVHAQNQIAGDKRYSLATLLMGDGGSEEDKRHSAPTWHAQGPGQSRPLMPSQIINYNHNHNNNPHQSLSFPAGTRVVSGLGPAPGLNKGDVNAGGSLLLSARILPLANGAPLRRMDEFTVEIFVQNLSDEVRRFRLGVPMMQGQGTGVGQGMGMGMGSGVMGGHGQRGKSGENALRHALAAASTTATHPTSSISPNINTTANSSIAPSPALLPLETDVRCGPLLPGASLAARLRFLALREGVHRVDRLRVMGMTGQDGLDYTISSVLDVIVGPSEGQ